MNCLPKEFFLQDDVLEVAQNLLGTYLFTDIDGQITGGIITETEAYKGICDRASHATCRTIRSRLLILLLQLWQTPTGYV